MGLTDNMTEERINKRLLAYRNQLESMQLDGFLVTREVNIRYLSGFTGDSSWLLVTPDHCFLLTDSRYTQQAGQETFGCDIVETKKSLDKSVIELALNHKVRALGFESSHMTVEGFYRLTQEADKRLELIAEADPCNLVRRRKDDEEIKWLRSAAQLGDEALGRIQAMIKPGITEKQLANELAYAMADLGSERLSFETIVASGLRGALPHGVPTNKNLSAGDMVTIDFGCVFGGYHSDMTRTFILGQPDKLQSQRYQLVLEAQMKAIEAIKPGKNTREIDQAARDLIKQAGYGDYFGHGLGHSVGLEIHEDPRFSPLSEAVVLEPGMVLTVEPGIYLPQWGGLRIEDMVVITENGYDILTKFPKALVDMTIIC
jgi:Xaa-Pro aminopeptidase